MSDTAAIKAKAAHTTDAANKHLQQLSYYGANSQLLLVQVVGVHEFNFYLDGEWKCDQKLPWSKDHNGCPRNLINVRQVFRLLFSMLILLTNPVNEFLILMSEETK